MEPVTLEVRVADEADVVLTLGQLIDAAMKLSDSEMVAYIQVAHSLLVKRAMQRQASLHRRREGSIFGDRSPWSGTNAIAPLKYPDA